VLGCVTTLRQALRSCQLVPLGEMRYVAVAQPAYAAQHCTQGLTPANFRSVPFIAFNHKDDLQAEFIARALRLRQVTPRQLYVPSSEGQVRAALDGWGASVVPELLVRAHLRTGRLVDLVPGFALPVQLYWHCWKLDSAVLAAVTQALTSAAKQSLAKASPTPS
jgi:LysR family transcriptional regulator (chromosome initiation inhibitor)